MNKILPRVAEIFVKIRQTIFTEEALDLKIKELVAIVSSILITRQFSGDEYSRRTMNQKTSREEVAEAIMLTMFIAESSQLCWENVYGKNIYELVFKDDNSKEKGNSCNCSSGNGGK